MMLDYSVSLLGRLCYILRELNFSGLLCDDCPQSDIPHVTVLVLCLALGGILQAGQWFAATDSSQSPQRTRDHSAVALTVRAAHARSTTLHRSPVLALRGSGFQDAALTQVSTLLPDRQPPVLPTL